MKKSIALILLPAFAALVLFYFNRDITPADNAQPTAADRLQAAKNLAAIAANTAPAKQAQKLAVVNQESALPKSQVSAVNRDIADNGNSADNASDSLFVESHKAKEFLQASGKLRDNLQGEVYIEISSNEIKSLQIGDTFKLEIPALDMFYDIEVDQTRVDQFGNQTIEAFLPDQEGKYSSIITVNEGAIYGNITTPHGIYAIEGNGRYAWIAETAGLLDGVIQDQIGGDGSTYDENHNHAPIDTGNGKRSSTH